MKKLIVIAVLATLALSGCTASEASVSEDGVVDNGMGAMSVTYYEVARPDGTTIPCVLAVGYYKGGITCDWGD